MEQIANLEDSIIGRICLGGPFSNSRTHPVGAVKASQPTRAFFELGLNGEGRPTVLRKIGFSFFELGNQEFANRHAGG